MGKGKGKEKEKANSYQSGSTKDNEKSLASGSKEMQRQPIGCSSNLAEALCFVDNLQVKQRVQPLEILTGYEQGNKYEIFNGIGQRVMVAAEGKNRLLHKKLLWEIQTLEVSPDEWERNRSDSSESRPSMHYVLVPLLPSSTYGVFPQQPLPHGQMLTIFQKVKVFSPPGHLIGYISQNWSLCFPSYTLKDESGKDILRATGPFCTFSCFGSEVEFEVLSKDKKSLVGRISKEWGGIIKEGLTDADNYNLFFPMDLDVKCKALLLGLTLLIDFMFFEGSVLLGYSRDYQSLLMCTDRLVSLRRDLAGSLFIKTALSTLVDKDSSDPSLANVKVEITLLEARKLKKYLDSPHINLASDSFKNVLDQLEQQMGSVSSDNDKFATVSVEGELNSLQSLFTSVLRDLKKVDGGWGMVRPVAAGILERLALFRPLPYNFELSLDGNGLDKSVMASEAARRLTFSQWPHMHYRWALPEQMAQAGFYHQPNTTGDDRVMCFTCAVCLVCWEPSDEPWSEHERHSPQCPFVRGEYTQNVPLALTYASTPAVEHDSPEHFHSISQTSRTPWMALSTQHGHIQLWHLNSLPQKGLDFRVDLGDAYIGMKTSYMVEGRRPTRVTWSDDSTGITPPESIVAETIKEVLSEITTSEIVQELQGGGKTSSEDLKVTALCACGKPAGVSPLGRNYSSPDLSCSSALVVGFGVDESRLRPLPSTDSPMVEVLNSVNLVNAGSCSVRIIPPQDPDAPHRVHYHPFILVYKIDENLGGGAGGGGGKPPSEKRRETGTDASMVSFMDQEAMGQYSLAQLNLDSSATMLTAEEAEILSDIEEELMGIPSGAEDPLWAEDMSNNNSSLMDPLGAQAVLPTSTSGFASLGMSLGMEESSKKMDGAHNGDFLQVQYDPLAANLLVLQCFRLPETFDCPDFRIENMIPSPDGCFLLVIVNKEEGAECLDDEVVSGMILYRMTFSGLMTGLVEVPFKEKVFRGSGMRIKSAVMISGDTVGLDFQNGDRIDAVSVLNEKGTLSILDLDSDDPIFLDKSGSRFLDLASIASDRLCGLTDEGELQLLQVLPPVFEQEDVLDAGINEILKDPLKFDLSALFPGFSSDYVGRNKTTKETLMQAWELTRSDWSNGVHFVAAAPSCWTEIQQQQRLRKNPQHYLREDKLTKSWQLTPNEGTWKEHVFELILPNNINVSHMDFRFSLQALCFGAPDIEVTLYRRKTGSSTDDGVKLLNGMEVEVVSGPFELGHFADLSDNSGIIQMTSPVLQSYKSRQFLLLVQTLNEESEMQRTWKQSQKDFLQQKKESYEKVSAAKSQYEDRGKHQHHPAGSFGASYYAMGFLEAMPKEGTWKATPLKPLPDLKKFEDRKGCDWLEEISITVWRTKKTNIPRERLQRTCLIASLDFQKEIVGVLRGWKFDKETDAGSVFLEQHLALDLSAWLFAQWTGRNTANLTMSFAEEILADTGGVMESCFIRASRSIAHKASMLLIEMLRTVKKQSLSVYRDVVCGLLEGIKGVLPVLAECGSSGSLMWLFSVFSFLVKSHPITSREVVQEILAVVVDIGGHLESRQNQDSAKLARYGLRGTPMDLEMYEWSPPVLSCQLWRNPAQQYTSYSNVVASGTQTFSTAWFSSEIAQDEVGWGEMLNVDSGDTEQNQGLGGFAAWSSLSKGSKGKRALLSREHLQGLLEVEPLSFACQTASEGVKVENLETGVTCCVVGGGSLGNSSGPGPIPLPDMAQVEGTGNVNPALASAVSSMKQQVQSILSKQMQLLALQQQKQKLTGKLQEHADPGTPAGSSASTFGVPTTPKTTPFMTPTPLSPTQLSPINSETNLHFEDHSDPQDLSLPTDASKDNAMHLMPVDLLKPPPYQALILDRMTSGARKFVVLDFGRPILLSDLIIPCSGELASVCIDVWLRGEGIDGQRLLVCSDITHKSLVVSDLQPPALCRFLKMTYIGRHGLGSCSCKIPLGSFYGYRFLAPWQLYPYGDLTQMERAETLQTPVSTKHLRQMAEDLRCKHQLASSQLKRLMEEEAEEAQVREAYKDCVHTKVQWNLAMGILERLESGGRKWMGPSKSWAQASTEQLRTTADVILGALTRVSRYVALAEKVERSGSVSLILDLDTATSLFRQMCVQGSARLQGLCSAWLFQWGTGSPWWGGFFVRLLKDLFSYSSQEQSGELFLLLCYLVGQTVRVGNRAIVVDLLKLLLNILQDPDHPVDSTLLSWLLYLLSVCFDVSSGTSSSRRKNNRWSFLAGDYNPSSRDSSTGDKDSSRKKLARKPATKVKWEETATMGVSLMEEQYQKTLALAEDIKQYVGKPAKQASGSLKVKKSDSHSSSGKSKHSKRYKHTRKRTKSSIRLKIPEELSRATAKALTDLLISDRVVLSPLASLVAFKVVAKCCCESVKPVGVCKILDERGLESFISLALSSRRSAWTRHAVSCVILDILEAEHKHRTMTTAKPSGFSLSDIPSSSVHSLFASPDLQDSASKSLTPDTPASAQQAIENALANIQLSDVPGCAIDDETRKKQLILLCKEMIHSNLNSGLPFSGLDTWVKTAKDTERNLACSCTSVSQYKTRVNKFLLLHSNSKDYLFDFLQTSMSSTAGASAFAEFPSHIPPPSSYAAHGPPAPYPFFPLVSDTSGSSSSGNPGYAEAKEKLSKLCEQLQHSSTTTSVFLGGAGTSAPAPGSIVLDINLDSVPGGDDASGSGESGQGSPTQTEADDSTFLDPSSSGLGDPNQSLLAIASRLMCLDVEVKKSVEQLQPVSLSLDERSECHLGWRAEMESRRTLLLDDTLCRMGLVSLCPVTKFPQPLTTTEGDGTGGEGRKPSLESLSRVMSNFFSTLTPGHSVSYVERLLTFFWNVLTGVSAVESSKSLEAEPVLGMKSPSLPLSSEAIQGLMAYLSQSSDLTVKVWTLALRVLTSAANLREVDGSAGAGMAGIIVSSRFFVIMLGRFVRESVGNFNNSGAVAGPAVTDALGTFLTRLHLFCDLPDRPVGTQLKISVIQVVIDILSNHMGDASYTVDVLSKVVEFLLGQEYGSLPGEVLSQFVSRVSVTVKRFLLHSEQAGSSMLGSGAVNPRFCFQAGSPEPAGTEFRTFADKHDLVVGNLLRLCHEICATDHPLSTDNERVGTTDDAKTEHPPSHLVDVVLEKENRIIEDLLAALSLCCSNTLAEYSSKAGKVLPSLVTVADWILQLLTTITSKVSRWELWMRPLSRFLSHSESLGSERGISGPVVFFFKSVMQTKERALQFMELDCGKVVSEQLMVSLTAPVSEDSAAQCKILRQLSSLASQIKGVENGSPKSSTKKNLEAKVEGMTNYAPLCQITSSSPMAHHLSALLTSTPPHRRARTAAWTYHFYPAESWLDLLLTLPYPILLKEIQIRPHLPSLQTGPSSVQVELGSENNPYCLTLLGPPVPTTGCSKVRISTEGFHRPVQLIKIHVKRPADSVNMGMSQILLLGHSPLTSYSDSDGSREQQNNFGYWLSLLEHMLEFPLDEGSLKLFQSPAQSTRLVSKLIFVFLSRTVGANLRNQISCVLAALDSSFQSTSIVDLLLDHCRKDVVQESVFPWLNHLLYYLCKTQTPDLHNRVKKIMEFMLEMLTERRQSWPDQILANLIWCAGCITWDPLPFHPTNDLLTEKLVSCVVELAGKNDGAVSEAAGWLLCSLCRNETSVLESVLEYCGLHSLRSFTNATDDGKREAADQKKEVWDLLAAPPKLLMVLSKAAMSSAAAHRLLKTGIMDALAESASSLCAMTTLKAELWQGRLNVLVEFFWRMGRVNVVKEWLVGAEFMGPLLKAITDQSFGRTELCREIERNTIGLVQTCLACHYEHQMRFSRTLCQILERITSGGLNGALQELILSTLLDEEQLQVLVHEKQTGNSKMETKNKEIRSYGKFWHPKFGCLRDTKLVRVSAFGTLEELLPYSGSGKKSGKTEKRVSISQDLWNPQIPAVLPPTVTPAIPTWIGGTPSSLAEMAGEYAKANRASKPGSDSAEKSNERAPSNRVNYLKCEALSQSPLDSSLTVGNVFCALDKDLNEILQLRLQSSTSEELKSMGNADVNLADSPKSTLEVFAGLGGLALLAQNLQLYQSSVSVRPQTTLSGFYSEKELYLMEQQKQEGGAFDPTTYYDPFEFIDMTSPGTTYYAPVESQIRSQGERLQGVASTGLSPHVVVAFSVFLRLSGYAELLVGEDRRRAQRLLRLTMGISSESGWSMSDNDSLSLLPFTVLGSLYYENPWSTDEGRLIRKASMDLSIPELLLACLSYFSHQQSRVQSEDVSGSDAVVLIEQLLNTSQKASSTPVLPSGVSDVPMGTDERNQFWAKGTGFGTGTTQQQWNVDLHVLKRKSDEQNVTCLLKVLTNFVCPVKWKEENLKESLVEKMRSGQTSQMPPRLVALFNKSSVAPALASYMRNDSVLDISRHTKVYEAVLQCLCGVSLEPSLWKLLREPSSDHSDSLATMIFKLRDCIQVYMQKLKPMSEKTEDEKGAEESANEEGLAKLVPLVTLCASLLEESGGTDSTDTSSDVKSLLLSGLLSSEDRYMAVMKEVQFESIPFFEESGAMVVGYHYESSVRGCRDSGSLAPRVRRLAQEAVTLSTSLPLSSSSSVFVRAAEERLDVMKVLITGPEGTPYWNGCFEFDVWFPTDYPNTPMHVSLETTGGHTVRFNPNLYNDGKVCLSVLNTWHGRPEERWNSQTSSFLQVLVSIQSLILVPDPYFNEPGYERSRGTPAGQQAAREYDANIRQATVRWGMLEMLRSPPACFKDVIQRHFWLKRDEIISQVAGWITEMEAQLAENTPTSSASSLPVEKRGFRNFGAHLTALKRHGAALKELLLKMDDPLDTQPPAEDPSEKID